MELHCRYLFLFVLVLTLDTAFGSEDAIRRLRREVFEIESLVESSNINNLDESGFGLRALKYEKSYKYEKYEKSDKKEKYEKKEKSYKYDKYDKSAKHATTRQVDIGGGVMMSMPLDIVMIDMSMSM